MVERITCTDLQDQCNCNREGFIELNVQDSFKLTYQFINNNFKPALRIPLDTFDLQIDYYIKDRKEVYTVIKEGLEGINCVMYPEKSIIKAIFNDHGLKAGHLYADFTFKYFDYEIQDKVATAHYTKDTKIILID